MACDCGCGALSHCIGLWDKEWEVNRDENNPLLRTKDHQPIATGTYKSRWTLEYIATLHNSFLRKNKREDEPLYRRTGMVALSDQDGSVLQTRMQIPDKEEIAPSLQLLLEGLPGINFEARPDQPFLRMSPTATHEFTWTTAQFDYADVSCSCGKEWKRVRVSMRSNKEFEESCSLFEMRHKLEVLLGLMNVYFNSNAGRVTLPEDDMPF